MMLELAWIAIAVWEFCPDCLVRGLCLIAAAPLIAHLAVEIGGTRPSPYGVPLVAREAAGQTVTGGGAPDSDGRDSKC